MRLYFADAWYFIALWDRFDGHHAAARRLERQLAHAAIITHDGVLGEVLAYFCEAGARTRQQTVVAVRRVLRTSHVEAMTRHLFERSLDLYATRLDKEYSLVDCTSMLIMRAYGLTHVLTNDHHFAQERFTVLSDAP